MTTCRAYKLSLVFSQLLIVKFLMNTLDCLSMNSPPCSVGKLDFFFSTLQNQASKVSMSWKYYIFLVLKEILNIMRFCFEAKYVRQRKHKNATCVTRVISFVSLNLNICVLQMVRYFSRHRGRSLAVTKTKNDFVKLIFARSKEKLGIKENIKYVCVNH